MVYDHTPQEGNPWEFRSQQKFVIKVVVNRHGAGWKIPFLCRKYIFNWSFFQTSYVGFMIYRVPWYRQLTWHQNPFKKLILATNMGGAKLLFKEDKLDHSFTKKQQSTFSGQLLFVVLRPLFIYPKVSPSNILDPTFHSPKLTIGQLPNQKLHLPFHLPTTPFF